MEQQKIVTKTCNLSNLQTDLNKKYDYGCCRNWLVVFNKNPLLWFLPLNKNDSGGGVFFDEDEI